VFVVGSNRQHKCETNDQSHKDRNPIPVKSQPLH
jgi:hypothetical protein